MAQFADFDGIDAPSHKHCAALRVLLGLLGLEKMLPPSVLDLSLSRLLSTESILSLNRNGSRRGPGRNASPIGRLQCQGFDDRCTQMCLRTGSLSEVLINCRVQCIVPWEDAECFCCSNGHRHPHDGSKLPCDRLLVYNTLRQWYGQEGEVDHLERFSRQVREELAPRIALLTGGMTLPLNYAVYMVGASFLPYLADHVAQWIASVHAGISGYALFALTLRRLTDWGTAPLSSMLASWMCLPMWKTSLRLKNRWCAAVAADIIIFVLVAVVWGPLQYLLASTAEDSLLPVAVFFAWFTLVLALFSCGQTALLWAMQTTVGEANDTAAEAMRETGKSAKVAEDVGREAMENPPLEGTFYI